MGLVHWLASKKILTQDNPGGQDQKALVESHEMDEETETKY